MTKDQAARWITQEFSKVKTPEEAENRIKSYRESVNGFFKSPAGIALGKKMPHARQAQHDLAEMISKKFNITINI
jgi:hypothetical protein